MSSYNTTDIAELTSLIKKRITPVLDRVTDADHKAAIENFWNKYVIDYFTKLASIDNSIKKEEIKAAEASNDVIIETDRVLKEGDKLEDLLKNPELIKKIKGLFRISGAPYGLQSQFVKHALEKPGGYAGDYEVLEFIYNNRPTSSGFGYCADETFLADDYAKAVRNRKDSMKKILKSFLETDPQNSKILNIACGSSRDLREIFKENTFKLTGNTTFTLIDKSKEALEFSEKELADHPEGIDFIFYNHSVYDYLKDQNKYQKLLAGQDIVYSIGLADYIPEDALKNLIAFFYTLLKPGGKVMIAHKDSKNYHPLTPDWWADWTFYLRNKEEVVKIAHDSGLTNYNLTVQQEDETNIIFFIIIEKK
ncbi:MAG TPA: class I SAM-dependent methyltransferase [Spirochaetota bacterium]|nr:class I SAM-dependent methyltransferase [Spirochaetota bacterium]HPI88085.1 class I SAM-dependent methyltransferase [Spirochaetota bacterium]HPR46430.1 class I SAM-dependent methyltransferase [Spirochaetota bacterium]